MACRQFIHYLMGSPSICPRAFCFLRSIYPGRDFCQAYLGCSMHSITRIPVKTQPTLNVRPNQAEHGCTAARFLGCAGLPANGGGTGFMLRSARLLLSFVKQESQKRYGHLFTLPGRCAELQPLITGAQTCCSPGAGP